MSNPVRHTYLFVPATRLDRVARAIGTVGDCVILDLEDSVSESDKISTRSALIDFEPPDMPILVRVNARDTPHWAQDLLAVSRLDYVRGVVLPMVSSEEDVRATRERLPQDKQIFALIESSLGISSVERIVTSGVERLMFGTIDYCAQLGATSSSEILAYPRSRLVVASAAYGLAPPIDGPCLDITDHELLKQESIAARVLGMGGKLSIHPIQVPRIEEFFGPSVAEVRWARAVVDAHSRSEGGVFLLDGVMVDRPVVTRAQQILADST